MAASRQPSTFRDTVRVRSVHSAIRLFGYSAICLAASTRPRPLSHPPPPPCSPPTHARVAFSSSRCWEIHNDFPIDSSSRPTTPSCVAVVRRCQDGAWPCVTRNVPAIDTRIRVCRVGGGGGGGGGGGVSSGHARACPAVSLSGDAIDGLVHQSAPNSLEKGPYRRNKDFAEQSRVKLSWQLEPRNAKTPPWT